MPLCSCCGPGGCGRVNAEVYATLDSEFLLEWPAALGAGDGFLAWVRCLLAGTRFTALVNGSLSTWVPIEAGDRQGYPVAPLLYLVVAQALLSWLRGQGFGCVLAGGQTEAASVLGVPVPSSCPGSATAGWRSARPAPRDSRSQRPTCAFYR